MHSEYSVGPEIEDYQSSLSAALGVVDPDFLLFILSEVEPGLSWLPSTTMSDGNEAPEGGWQGYEALAEEGLDDPLWVDEVS